MADSKYAQIPTDHYGAGGLVTQLELEVAELLGKETAVFMPSGTMAQQIALRYWCDRAENPTIAYHPTCHLEIHEQKAYRELHHLRAILLGEPHRLFNLEDLDAVQERIAALLIELPQREIGGQLPSWAELITQCKSARERGIKLHLDGARLWECAPYYGKSYREIAALFDSVYVSFYKTLRGLPGAILAGPAELIGEARIWQRRHGGNLYTLAPNAIAAKLGLERHLPQIASYCEKAKKIATALQGIDGLSIVPKMPPTNMMHLHFRGDKEAIEEGFWAIAQETGLLLGRSVSPADAANGWKMEIGISEANLSLDLDLLTEQMTRLMQRAGALQSSS